MQFDERDEESLAVRYQVMAPLPMAIAVHASIWFDVDAVRDRSPWID
jgi:hypothetical protein